MTGPSLLYLPAYNFGLNAIERLWGSLKSHSLGNKVDGNYGDFTRYPPSLEKPGAVQHLINSALIAIPNGRHMRFNQNPYSLMRLYTGLSDNT
jgi:transposase